MSNKMHLLFYLIAVMIVSALADDMKIDVTYKPQECTRQSKKYDMLSMHYKGMLEDGTEFDSNQSPATPFKFQLGTGQVIRGWDQGLLDMCVGEKRTLTIPSHLAYGDDGAGSKIPPKATLKFEVECVKIEDGESPANIFKEIDANGDNQLSREEVSSYLRSQIPESARSGDQKLDEDKLVEEIFQHEDLNKNGYISHEEFSGPKHDEL